jgi:hypothetical protein
MKNYWIFRLIGVVILLIALVAVGIFAYNMGLAQGQSAAVTAPQAGVIEMSRGGFGFHPLQALAALPFLFCGGLFFLILFILIPLRMVFGPHRMGIRMHGQCEGEEGPGPMHFHGHWKKWEGDVPPPVEEWHRRMHEKKDQGS